MKKNVIIKKGMISVIIPVFQAEKYLERCVASVTEQTYRELEVILIDDGSTDDSLSLCNKLAEGDHRIRVFHHENKGVAATRNLGLDCASGEFVFFLDSDDWIDGNTLGEMKASMEEHASDLCICGFNYTDDQMQRKVSLSFSGAVSKSVFMEKYFWDLYERSVLFNIGTKLYKRSLIEECNLRFWEDAVVYEDIRFCLEYIDKSLNISMKEEPCYFYYQGNTASITHVYKADFWRSTWQYCNLLINMFEDTSASFKKAVLLCLYRAYLQECHNPDIKKQDFLEKLGKYCFPVAEDVNLKGLSGTGLSIDQKVFLKLAGHKAWWVLWRLAGIIKARNT